MKYYLLLLNKCGSCYVFATVAVVESAYAIRFGGEKVILSEHEVIDCNSLSLECNGGNFNETFTYVVNNGVHLAKIYKSNMQNGYTRQRCNVQNFQEKNTSLVERFKNLRYTILPEDELSIMWWLKNQGPVYLGGVDMISGWDNNIGQIVKRKGHALMLVGYGFLKSKNEERSTPYWILKNSWGTSKGFNGYYRYFADGNLGNIASRAVGVFFDDDPMDWIHQSPHSKV